MHSLSNQKDCLVGRTKDPNLLENSQSLQSREQQQHNTELWLTLMLTERTLTSSTAIKCPA